jgi:putative oxidoreductase
MPPPELVQDKKPRRETMAALGLLVIRLIVGLTVAGHGAQKLFGWFGGPRISGFAGMLQRLGVRPSAPFAVLAGTAELLGGLGLALGLLTPLAGLAIVASMLVAIVLVHLGKGFWNQDGGYEFPLSILAAALGISLAGPGPLAIDRLIGFAISPALWILAAVVMLLAVTLAIGSARVAAGSARRALG